MILIPKVHKVLLVITMSCILSRDEILKRLGKDLQIEPFFDESLGELSYDLSLGNEFLSVQHHKTSIIDPERLNLKEERVFASEIFLQPHSFVLGRSQEYIYLPSDILGLVSGKSSLARLGIQVETAYLLHPGHKGFVVLEISNHNSVPVRLKSGMLIAQLIFFKVPRVKPYHQHGSFKEQKRIELPKYIRFVT